MRLRMVLRLQMKFHRRMKNTKEIKTETNSTQTTAPATAKPASTKVLHIIKKFRYLPSIIMKLKFETKIKQITSGSNNSRAKFEQINKY